MNRETATRQVKPARKKRGHSFAFFEKSVLPAKSHPRFLSKFHTNLIGIFVLFFVSVSRRLPTLTGSSAKSPTDSLANRRNKDVLTSLHEDREPARDLEAAIESGSTLTARLARGLAILAKLFWRSSSPWLSRQRPPFHAIDRDRSSDNRSACESISHRSP